MPHRRLSREQLDEVRRLEEYLASRHHAPIPVEAHGPSPGPHQAPAPRSAPPLPSERSPQPPVSARSAEPLPSSRSAGPLPTSRSPQPRLGTDTLVLTGSAHPELASAVGRELGLDGAHHAVGRFADGELDVSVGDVLGRRVVLVQPTAWPGGEHLLELLLIADACRRAGSGPLVAVLPYVGYARHDHRTSPGQPLGMKVVADILGTGHFERLIAVDMHADAIEGFFDVTVEHLTAAPLLAEAVRPHAGEGSVVVSPDLGAMKRARAVAAELGLPVAVVDKARSAEGVSVGRVTGEVEGRRPILVDDMITTGGTIAAAVEALLARHCSPDITVLATHAVLSGAAGERLAQVGVGRLIVTDTLPSRAAPPLPCKVVSVAALIAEAVLRRG